MPGKKQKVIIVGPAFPLRGGIANFNEALCRALNAAGKDAKIFSFSLQYPGFLFPGKTQFETGKGPEDLAIETTINSVNPLSWYKTARLIRKENPDYVIFRYWLPFMGPCLGTIAKLIKKGTSIKTIAITDNVIPHEKRFGDKGFTSYFVKQIDGFIAMSQSVLSDLKEFTNTDKTAFLPHPIYDIFGEKVNKPDALKHLGFREDEKHILFFGFIRKYKGLDLLLEAMADPRVKQMGVKLIVAGEYYEDDAPYNEIIQRNGLQKSVILRTEYIPSEEVRYYFCASDMVAQPYKTATQSGVTQIAYHFEKPMLVTNVGGLPEIVPDKRVGYVTAVNPLAIADAIVDFYSLQREDEFTKNTIEEKKRFLWSSFVNGVEGLVGRL
ncbi:MAG: glycosyl transferase family 1 [Bacteroidota bacterium]|jgi:glycosyltransferase involved in cell wall biosynthesis|nr:glycosyl transferase family 1 [Bacteroidota bacterium]